MIFPLDGGARSDNARIGSRRMLFAVPALLFASAAIAVSVRFDGSKELEAPFPSNRFTVPALNQITGVRVKLPRPDCASRVHECQDIDAINSLDGFNIQARISIPFSGDIGLKSMRPESIYLVATGSPRRIALNQLQWDSLSKTLIAAPDEVLRQQTRYLLVVTDDVRTESGERVDPRPFWRAVDGDRRVDARRYRAALDGALRERGLSRQHVAAASLFTTLSVTADLEKIRAQIRQSAPSAVDFGIATAGADGRPVRATFEAKNVAGIVFHRQTGTESGTAPVFTDVAVRMEWLGVSPGSVATIGYGRFYSPDYLDPDVGLPTVPSRSDARAARRLRPLVVEVFVPSGKRPPAGWPVAIVGHGLGGAIYNVPWTIAPQLAAQGIATVAINVVGHGGGERGTLEVSLRDGSRVALPAGGRGVDQDGDGRIGSFEGATATSPRGIVQRRDSWRQTTIDLMQLVREIELGIDVDGDRQVDLDRRRIYYLGHSAGAIYGIPFVAVETAVRAGAFVTFGGSNADIMRLGDLRELLFPYLEQRGLLNVPAENGPEKPHQAFVDNVPLRDQPPSINSTPGAAAIQQFLDRMSWVYQRGDPVAYAPHLRASPLPGRPPRKVLLIIARGDRLLSNPTNSAVVRSGKLEDRTTLYRADLAYRTNPSEISKDPHNFILRVTTAERPYALAAQRQIATFFASDGATVIDPDGSEAIFETPIKLPLPEDLGFFP
jgi:hypothetical protein